MRTITTRAAPGRRDAWRPSDLLGAVRRLVLGPDAPATVPARARAAIQDAQDQSEILVGWVQVGAILTFAVLYTISPKAFPPSVPFEPVPWALASYSGFIALRLWLAYRRRLTPLFLAASVLVDMAVLMVTIWSFHLQYQQPAALYVKAPTLMYAFILIALRALRFEAGYILLAGATAALGWLALVLYAVFDGAGGAIVTRDYVAYMTSFQILLGAEFDKIVSLVMVAVILAVVVLRARRMLQRATAERLAAAELSRFFAPEVALRITSADMAISPGHGELRDAAVLVLDLRGFTRLAQTLEPDAVMALLGDYQKRLVPVIQRHGGSIDKYLGDGILASFGAVRPSPRYAADGLGALAEISATAVQWQQERAAAGLPCPKVGAGLATGRVMFGAIGDNDRLEYTVIGDAVNLAAKLEAHTKVAGVAALTTAAALALARAQGFATRESWPVLRAAAVSGVDGPIDLVAVGGQARA